MNIKKKKSVLINNCLPDSEQQLAVTNVNDLSPSLTTVWVGRRGGAEPNVLQWGQDPACFSFSSGTSALAKSKSSAVTQWIKLGEKPVGDATLVPQVFSQHRRPWISLTEEWNFVLFPSRSRKVKTQVESQFAKALSSCFFHF